MEQPEYYPRWGHEIVSDAEDHPRAKNADLQARRRKPVAKRHIRPTAGGAPLVSCYHCSEPTASCRLSHFQEEVSSSKMGHLHHGSKILTTVQNSFNLCSNT